MSLRATAAGVAAPLAASLLLLLVLPGAHAQPAPAPPPDAAVENAPTDAPAGADDANLPIPPVPPRIAQGARYEACLDKLSTDPSGADAMAASIAAEPAASGAGGPEAAAHCHALAQVELGNTEEGANLLDRLATTSAAPAVFRAVVFAQASQAWSMAGHADQAYASASNALALSPDDADLRIGHAIAALALQKFAEAADDAGQALDQDPKRADALVLRATAERNLNQLPRARADIDAACSLDPDDPDGLLERGIIRQRTGNLAGARQDWQRVVELSPDTPTGDLAQQNLALLDAGPKQ